MFTSAGRRAGATGELDLGNILFNYPGFSVGNSDEVYGSGYFGVQDASGSEYGQIGADYTFPVGRSAPTTRFRGLHYWCELWRNQTER
jgi:hypothetical protein